MTAPASRAEDSTSSARGIIDDLIAELDARTLGNPIHHDELDEYAEYIVNWLGRRGALTTTPLGPILFLLTEQARTGSHTHGLYASHTDAVIAARTLAARRYRAPSPGGTWATTADPDNGNRLHSWAPTMPGSAGVRYTIREIRAQ